MNFLNTIWRNEKSREIIVQIFVLFCIGWILSWLIANVDANFKALGKDISFEFLFIPAGYDINQYLIDYNNRDSHLRAGIVGLLNTGLVAVFGIILATVLGVFLGIIRLSKNWLASKLAYWYIEFSRNVPILLHILLWHGIIINTLPHPKKALNLGDLTFLSNRGFYIPKPLTENGIELVYLFLVIAIIFAVLFFKYARRKQDLTGVQYPVFWINLSVIILLPTIAFFISGMPISLEIPALRGFNFRGGMHMSPELAALTFALGIYTAAFIAEIVRAGIMAVDKGQREAAESIGLKPSKVMNLVILPQARRVIIPPLTSQYLNLTKNSSLAIAIGYMDLVATLGGISLNQTGREMETMVIVMLIYLSVSLSISAFMNWYNNKAKLVGR
ncbi:ABC transporter permease subunit [Alphaproteobacteria bacterium]|jgi:general L-amino acid transport system permease protein|nr:ABC transporter permease subunit [Alphaproteobacteria bacterium]MDB2388374.1 ABC transporter permease subunit [Alphaproteobacteria bacterium]MDB2479131.1 ABC transporter permease subunit [Alphaproteobacteria bacterium]|tara:strand:- start:334 stop:1497 length:1164 start_codon:yes stop_codon:yes gene_type:complete